ncbi:MAG: APC family permease [Oscillospiraceae bacterium]|jgi:amino acid transporter|nr:APC family permease [Oscillospiraceae bacterium]
MKENKKLGLGSGVAVCMGLIVATSCLVSLGQGSGLAGKSFVLPLIIVAILNSFIALSFSELHSIIPNADGGLGQYMLVGLGPWASIVSNLSAYVLVSFFALSVELSMCGIVLNELFPLIPAPAFSIFIIAALFIVNLLGVDIFAKVQNVTVVLLIGSMFVIGVLALLRLGTNAAIAPADIEAAPMSSFGDLISLSALAFWLFIGVEFIVPFSKNLRNPRRNVLLSMVIALGVLAVVQAILGMGMTNYVPLSQLQESDMPHVLFAEKMFGKGGGIWMAIVSVLASISTVNTILPATGSILKGMADEKMAPSIFARVNKKNVPYGGMVLILVVVVGMIASGYVNSSGLINMLLAGSCFWLASYILTHLNVLVLRKRYPDAPRNKKLVLGGVPQIVGILGNIYMIWNISPVMDDRMLIFRLFSVLFAILAAFAFIWVGVVRKSKPFEPVPIDKLNADIGVALPEIKAVL